MRGISLIVEEINRRFLIELRAKFPDDYQKQNRMSIIHDGKVYMAWLAIHAGFSVNGVAALHTELLKNVELKDWYGLYPQKFNNKTNGITQRRWLCNANPELAKFFAGSLVFFRTASKKRSGSNHCQNNT